MRKKDTTFPRICSGDGMDQEELATTSIDRRLRAVEWGMVDLLSLS